MNPDKAGAIAGLGLFILLCGWLVINIDEIATSVGVDQVDVQEWGVGR